VAKSKTIAQISEITTTIASAVEEQSAATREVAQNIQGVTTASQETGRSSEMLLSAAVNGGMKPKLRACIAAIAGGVDEVVIAGPSRHALALAGGEGGTCVVAA